MVFCFTGGKFSNTLEVYSISVLAMFHNLDIIFKLENRRRRKEMFFSCNKINAFIKRMAWEDSQDEEEWGRGGDDSREPAAHTGMV